MNLFLADRAPTHTNVLAAWLLAFALMLSPHLVRGEETVFTYLSPESEFDKRYDYDTALLRLALEKTKAKYGPYRLEPSPSMNFARAKSLISENEFPNFFVQFSYDDRLVLQQSMTFAKFPVDLGIVGYRVCFTNPQSKLRLQAVRSLDDLRKFSIGQGRGWSDIRILRHNDFQVIEVSSYESLFKMTAANRFDLFCRGANELLEEFEAHKDIANLTYDESISLAYPLPRFFFTHQSNHKAAKRIEEGLLAAYRDGTLQALWRKNYSSSIEFVRLDKRRIFWIENPLLKNLDFDYRQFIYKPLPESKRKRLATN